MEKLYFVVSLIIAFLQVCIIVRSLMSFFPTSSRNPLTDFLFTVTEPILSPLRRIVPRLGMVDITPMLAILILFGIQYLLETARNS